MAKSIVAPIAGAAVGGLMGGGESTQTVDSTPQLYKGSKGQALFGDTQDAYQKLLQQALGLNSTPFTPTPTKRVSSVGAYGGIFDNPELQAIQNQADYDYLKSQFPKETTPQIDNSAADKAAGDASYARQLISQLMQGQGMISSSALRPWQEFMQSATQDDLAEAGAKLQGARIGQGNMAGGFIDAQGMPIDLSTLLAKYRYAPE